MYADQLTNSHFLTKMRQHPQTPPKHLPKKFKYVKIKKFVPVKEEDDDVMIKCFFTLNDDDNKYLQILGVLFSWLFLFFMIWVNDL